MQLTTARDELGAQLGLDTASSDTSTLLTRWLNLAYQDIVGTTNWAWLESRESVTTVVDYTTGTVSVDAGSATLTFSAVITDSQANKFIQFSTTNDWYEITAHTAGADTATISPVYAQTDNLSAGTYTIRKFYYSLSSDVEYVQTCRQAISNRYIDVIDARKYDLHLAFPTDTGNTRQIVIWGQDSSGNWKFTPFPFPDAAILLEFRTTNKITELSTATSEPLFPARFNSIWLDRAKCYGYEFNDDDRAPLAFARSKKRMKEMKGRDTVGANKFRILKSIDEGRSIGSIIRFPPEFGEVRG